MQHPKVRRISATLSGFDDKCGSQVDTKLLVVQQSVATSGFLIKNRNQQVSPRPSMQNQFVDVAPTEVNVQSGEYIKRTLAYGVDSLQENASVFANNEASD